MYYFELLKKSSNVLNIFKLDSLLFMQYQHIVEGERMKYYDVFSIDETNQQITLLEENMKFIRRNDYFGIEDMEFGTIRNMDNNLSYIAKFPFDKNTKFVSKEDFEEKSYDAVLETGKQYTLIIKKLK